MKLQILILFLFTLIIKCGFTQTEEYRKRLVGTWVAMKAEDGILFKKADEFEVENYGMTFSEEGTLTRRSAKGMFEVTWYNHQGKWHFDDSTLILIYIFDEKQKAEEKVIIKQLDDQFLKLERIGWIEIRE